MSTTRKDLLIEAKKLNIKKYYKMNKSQLSQAISSALNQNSEDDIDVSILKPKLFKKDLIIEAKNQGIKNYSYMKKCQIEEILTDRLTIPKIQNELKFFLECEHGKNKYLCKDCGKNYCEHKRQKHQCKDCGGKNYCKHDRLKFQCKDCGGKNYCKHDRLKFQCKDCVGRKKSIFCLHGKQRHQCKICLFQKYKEIFELEKIKK